MNLPLRLSLELRLPLDWSDHLDLDMVIADAAVSARGERGIAVHAIAQFRVELAEFAEDREKASGHFFVPHGCIDEFVEDLDELRRCTREDTLSFLFMQLADTNDGCGYPAGTVPMLRMIG